ncbi:MAG: hypothetical protein ACFCD0_21960 [Gemmataceae bacterium]
MNQKRLVSIGLGFILALFVVNSLAHTQPERIDNSPTDWGGPSVERPKLMSVIGDGAATLQEAKMNAYNEAAKHVARYLKTQPYPFVWYPSGDYTRDHLRDETKTMVVHDDQELQQKVCNVYVSITAEDYHRLLIMDQQHRKEERTKALHSRGEKRMQVLGKWMAFCFVALLLVQGYYRLEMHTRGYLTGWLALGTIMGLVLVGAFLLYLW